MISIQPTHGPISAHFLHRAFLGCQKLGARKPVLLNSMGIDEADLRNPRNRFAAENLASLVRAAGAEIGNKELYHKLGAKMLPSCFSDAGYSAMFERSFGDALKAALIAQDLGGEKIPYRFEERGGSVFLFWDDPANTPEFVQLLFSNIIHIGNVLSLEAASLIKSIQFSHPKPVDFDHNWNGNLGHFRLPCAFNRENSCIEFDREFSRAQNTKANSQVVYSASRRRLGFEHSDSEMISFSKLCYNYLAYLLDKSGLSLDAAAETFGMAERTLRRKLVAEDESFRHILERVRRDACQLYFLEGGRSLSEISAKLGYSELSAFTRAYTAWYGHPPSRDMPSQTALAA